MSTSPTSLDRPGDATEAQRAHYDRIITEYESHYDDPTSGSYRRRFLYEPLMGTLGLAGRDVLEAMCGSGQATGWLLERGARVTGLDVSDSAMSAFRRRWPGATAVRASILQSGLGDESFDGVVVIGGLHHLHPHLDEAMDQIDRVLKPGGWFCFGEPHAGSLPDIVRQWWYRHDRLFEPGEAAIDLAALRAANARRFEVELERYVGGVAYMLVLNSMILRIPPAIKPLYAGPLFLLERAFSPLLGRRTACFALSRWRKRSRGRG